MIEMIHTRMIPAALSLLPPEMDTPEARAMLLAIGLQESRFEYRRQVGGGPARGFWQFELGGGVKGVTSHHDTEAHVVSALCALRYDALTSEQGVYEAIEHNDVLACVCARLLLWTLPARLPRREEAAMGWTQYIAAWRPGKPKPNTWQGHFAAAWKMVEP